MEKPKNIFTNLLSSTNTRSFLILLFMVTFAHSLLLSTQGLDYYGEGVNIYGASEILDGKVLYKDIWSNYTPGQYYLLALVFKFFGQTIIAERIFYAFTRSIVIFCIYLAAHKLVRDATALFSWFFALAFLCGQILYGSPSLTAFLLCILSCLCVLRYFEAKNRIWLLLSGIFTGFTTLFRHDFGCYTFFSICVATTLFAYRGQDLAGQNLSRKFRKCIKTFVPLLSGLVIIVTPVAVYFLIKVPINILFEDLILFPSTVYSKFRSIPWPFYPKIITLFFEDPSRVLRHMIKTSLVSNFMLAVSVLLAVHLLLVYWRKRNFTTKEWSGLLFLIMIGVFFNYSRVFSDIHHMMPQILIAVIVLPWLCREFAQNPQLRFYSFLRILSVFLIIVAFIVFVPMFLQPTGNKLGFSKNEKYVELKIDRARYIEIESSEAEDLQQAVAFIKDVTDPGEKIFVGLTRHDVIWVCSPIFYFLAERDNPTIFNDMHPGLITTEPIQKKIIEDLIRNKVRYIVLTDGHAENYPDDESSENSKLLDIFIESNYNEVQSFGDYTILCSKKS